MKAKREGALTAKELNPAMMSMAQEKAPGNDGLTKEFYSCFWEELKNLLLPPLELQNVK